MTVHPSFWGCLSSLCLVSRVLSGGASHPVLSAGLCRLLRLLLLCLLLSLGPVSSLCLCLALSVSCTHAHCSSCIHACFLLPTPLFQAGSRLSPALPTSRASTLGREGLQELTDLLTVGRPWPSALRTLLLFWTLRPCLLLLGWGLKAEAGAEGVEGSGRCGEAPLSWRGKWRPRRGAAEEPRKAFWWRRHAFCGLLPLAACAVCLEAVLPTRGFFFFFPFP